jgi:hypothetical protein
MPSGRSSARAGLEFYFTHRPCPEIHSLPLRRLASVRARRRGRCAMTKRGLALLIFRARVRMAWRAGEQRSAARRVAKDAAPARLSRALAATLAADPARARVLLTVSTFLLDHPAAEGVTSLAGATTGRRALAASDGESCRAQPRASPLAQVLVGVRGAGVRRRLELWPALLPAARLRARSSDYERVAEARCKGACQTEHLTLLGVFRLLHGTTARLAGVHAGMRAERNICVRCESRQSCRRQDRDNESLGLRLAFDRRQVRRTAVS